MGIRPLGLSLLLVAVFTVPAFAPRANMPYHQAKTAPLRVGIFADRGVGDSPAHARRYAGDLLITLKTMDPRCRAKLITSMDIRRGALHGLDVVIFPGGSGAGQMKSLGKGAAARVREFIRRGGGYVGICAGAYLARSPLPDSREKVLSIVPAVLADGGNYWERGAGIVKVALTETGNRAFPEISSGGNVFIHYHNGPVLVPHKVPGLAPFETLMVFGSDCVRGNEAADEVAGRPFMLRSRFGSGRIILVSGHPEATPGLRWVLHRMVTMAAERENVKYPPVLTDTGKVKEEVLYTKEMREGELLGLEILDRSETEEEPVVLAFIEELKKMVSRKLAEKLPPLLGHSSKEIRTSAARAVAFYEYFPALPAVKKALSKEKDPAVSAILMEANQILDPKISP